MNVAILKILKNKNFKEKKGVFLLIKILFFKTKKNPAFNIS